MPKYVKKPVVIDAVKFVNNSFPSEPWVEAAYRNRQWGYTFLKLDKPSGFFVETLEGTMRGGDGDYLVCGVKGELYICRGDICEGTY